MVMTKMRYLFCFLVSVSCLSASDGQFQIRKNSVVNLREKVVEWLEREQIDIPYNEKIELVEFLYGIFEGVGLAERSVVPTAFANVSAECKAESEIYLNALREWDPMALIMRASNGELHLGGIGSKSSIGIFDDCLAIGEWNIEEFPIRGRYCQVGFQFAEINQSEILPFEDGIHKLRGSSITLFEFIELILKKGKVTPKELPGIPGEMFNDQHWSTGLCVPSACSAYDVRYAVAQLVGQNAVPNIFNFTGKNASFISIATSTDERFCMAEDDPRQPFTGADIEVIVILSVIGFLVASASIHEFVRMYFDSPIDPNNETMAVRVLHCFSVINNSRKLLATTSSSDNLACVHGIRVLSTTWVVMGHSYYELQYILSVTVVTIIHDQKKGQLQTILNGTLSVDSFFLLSGMLVSYLLLRQLDRGKGQFNVFLFYLHRYLRLTPVLAIIMGFMATLAVYLGTGPFWPNLPIDTNYCRDLWWRNMLYINNYFDPSCMGETWYLACDMQMFILSPFLVYPLWRWKRLGVYWNLFLISASLAAGIAVWAVEKYPWVNPARFTDTPSDTFMLHYYQNPGLRCPPYIWGILLGYVLHITKNKPIKLNKVQVGIMWIIAFAIGLSVVYGEVPYMDSEKFPQLNDYLRVIYGSLSRMGWAIALSWVVFACVKGYGGIINSILSWKAFWPLGRVTYCVYLVHMNVFVLYRSQLRQILYYNTFTHILFMFGMILCVFLLAFFVSVTIEASFMNLEKLIFSPLQKKRPEQVKSTQPTIVVNQ